MKIEGGNAIMGHYNQRQCADKLTSPTVVSCDAATVASFESSTNENGGTSSSTTVTTSSMSTSSEAAVIVAHRSWMTASLSSKRKMNDDTIPRAITMLTTTPTITKQRPQLYYSNSTISLGGSLAINSSTSGVVDQLSATELYQHLQKRLRPEDIPSIPTLSTRNQRPRFHNISTTATTETMVGNSNTDTTGSNAQYYRPTCNFVNYMSTTGQTVQQQSYRTTSQFLSTPSNDRYNYHHHSSRFVEFPASLITLQENDKKDGLGTTITHPPTSSSVYFDSNVTVDDEDDDMFLLSNLETIDWGILPATVEGTGGDLTEDCLLRNESIEPYQFTSCSLPTTIDCAANKVKHSDNYGTTTTTTDMSDKALFDSFNFQGHDDVVDLFDFD